MFKKSYQHFNIEIYRRFLKKLFQFLKPLICDRDHCFLKLLKQAFQIFGNTYKNMSQCAFTNIFAIFCSLFFALRYFFLLDIKILYTNFIDYQSSNTKSSTISFNIVPFKLTLAGFSRIRDIAKSISL